MPQISASAPSSLTQSVAYVHNPQFRSCAHLQSKSTTRASIAPSTRSSLTLHLFRHLDVRLEELANASVQAHRLALVQVCLSVCVWDTFLRACLDEPETHIRKIIRVYDDLAT